MPHTPLLSVVIPTYKRPEFLPRAIDSALQAAPGGSVEVVIVPNGADESWKNVAEKYSHDSRVLWHPIGKPHANIARNHGLLLAKGKYIRFLDDDDYLLPGAIGQLVKMDKESIDICSGEVINVDLDGTCLDTLSSAESTDFVCAAASISGFTLPVGNVYLRSSIKNSRWDESVNRSQDYAWMIDLALAQEWRWLHVDNQVGAWVQHPQGRTSSTEPLRDRQEHIIRRLIDLNHALSRGSRSTADRRKAIARSLLYYAHRGFPSHPFYWFDIGSIARKISEDSLPPQPLFSIFPFSSMNPLITELMILPPRLVSRAWKGAGLSGRPDYRRHI